jgi:hypothetical protein
MKRNISFYLLIVFSFSVILKVYAQDSLFLVGTITGESTEKHLIDFRGIGDVNGDGYDDFIISMRTGNVGRDQGIVKLYFGSPNFDLNSDVIFHYPGNDYLNDFSDGYGIGDVNNDGYNDFILCGGFPSPLPKGKVFLYYGGEIIDTIPVAEFYQPNSSVDNFGYPVERLGDINNDEYDDFAISSPRPNVEGSVYFFWGGDTISWDRSITFSSDSIGDEFGISVSNVGDLNNDSYDDIAIGAPIGSFYSDYGKVFFYFGGSHFDNIPDTILTSSNPGDEFGRIIKNAGDLNSDGATDFCISGYPGIFIFTKGFNDPSSINGYNIDGNGDINNDGFDDLIVGDDWKIKIYLGSEIFDTTYDLCIKDTDSLGFTMHISFAGDINDDGYDEIFALAPYFPNPDNPLGKVFIYSYNKINSVPLSEEKHHYQFQLYQNYPNPFNPTTFLSWKLESKAYVSLIIYDILGNKITTLIDEEKPAGNYSTEFDASNYRLSSGIYFCWLKIRGGGSATIKMVLVR